MNVVDFIQKYFANWRIASVLSCGTMHGYLKLRQNETFIKVYFSLNGSKHWADYRATVDHVTSDE